MTAGPDCYRAARTGGLAPALESLTAALLPGALPYGPAGHAVTTATVAASATHAWFDGVRHDREPEGERTPAVAAVPGGPVLILRRAAPTAVGRPSAVPHHAWLSGLAWLRLGLSEALRLSCMDYLGGRRVGATATLLHQQLVKGTVAEAVAVHLEAHAVLRALDGEASGAAERVHRLITGADRELVRLLGASGYVTGGVGQVADASELLADAYCRQEPPC
ncbi:hypothetical protein Pa4123_45580 [Phytohabitans aurantiacus]|uniref:Acyl-CoA dehydrogenase/oxidase C-terminal domain-containing protein n=2 Tax=Phytohabitans aurantiacus TaxID=3016789 RepID=A0ABQ5QXL1_9ACTN|nr:hypothetical protein Pa4123_45580 [Phytohabitans aurantiacus]